MAFGSCTVVFCQAVYHSMLIQFERGVRSYPSQDPGRYSLGYTPPFWGSCLHGYRDQQPTPAAYIRTRIGERTCHILSYVFISSLPIDRYFF
ncbi:hypothetical protein BJX70DRAFT_381895 [Aspergillus crustosus]